MLVATSIVGTRSGRANWARSVRSSPVSLPTPSLVLTRALGMALTRFRFMGPPRGRGQAGEGSLSGLTIHPIPGVEERPGNSSRYSKAVECSDRPRRQWETMPLSGAIVVDESNGVAPGSVLDPVGVVGSPSTPP